MRRKNLFELPANFEVDDSPIQWGKGSPYGWGYDGEVTRELWRPVRKYKNLDVVDGYWVSNYGRVYSQLRNMILKQNKDTAKRPYVRFVVMMANHTI